MRSWVFVAVTLTFVGAIQAAIYPWIPLSPWWFRAPDKDTPPVVNIQQQGGNYQLSSVEGKAYHALSPATVVQPPVSAVHVQSVPSASLQYLQNGQAILLISPQVAPSSGGQGGADDSNSETGTDNPEGEPTKPNNVADQESPREPAPVTEQSEDYATESS
ncbi:AAEL005768-PA [Aedes aegypti]|uniref:AAEL005768-PA n=1 Tax=Aedes aegypti TaxID=7159 RepID=Q178T3_AEDAE|nr:AAEL005768-PA [Aedes aegypti]